MSVVLYRPCSHNSSCPLHLTRFARLRFNVFQFWLSSWYTWQGCPEAKNMREVKNLFLYAK